MCFLSGQFFQFLIPDQRCQHYTANLEFISFSCHNFCLSKNHSDDKIYSEMQQQTLIRPDDWHLHLRDSPYLESVLPHTAAQFERAIIMPNLNPPVTTCQLASDYLQRITAALPENSRFQPLMTLYLTDNTNPVEIVTASQSDFIFAAKLYPAGATTNSDDGVTHINKISAVLEAMQKHQLPLLVHGETTATNVDVFDREKVFIDQTMIKLRQDFPDLRIVFEHITTSEAVNFILSENQNIAATITPHHLMINRNAIFQGGLRPHHYCLPVAKREVHRLALVLAATGKSKKFFAGTDSAPHSQHAKESACGCAGIYSAFCAIELYAEVFEQANNFNNFENFMSRNGSEFYRLAQNSDTITLQKAEWQIPEKLDFANTNIIPFHAGHTLQWKLVQSQ